uniref:Uncharacterized 9.4 kDa protein n=1 Tax=Streptomyces lividans TaxID=1916 RepID=Y9KD_STRLI|nr:RecName: Full=Uncharacterized 9.4 kDa protein; AltName: Full=ORF 85 [Streptomyces lividans]AAA88413.1 unknown [Streptomyces lividans]
MRWRPSSWSAVRLRRGRSSGCPIVVGKMPAEPADLDRDGYPAGRGRASVEGEGGRHADRHGGPQAQELPHDQRPADQEQCGQHCR